MRRAAGRSIVAIAEHVAADGTRNAHVVTGTLRRSIHAAEVGYDGGGDEETARTAKIGNVSQASYEGHGASVEVGSWLPYACVEEVGRGHQFITPAVEASRGYADGVVLQAVKAEGL